MNLIYKITKSKYYKMSILKAATKIIKAYVVLNNKNAKNFIVNIRRSNKTYTHSIPVQKSKNKEPGELIKWLLLMIPVSSFGLGCWQVYRLQWKLELIDMLQAKSNSKPIPMPHDFEELEKLEYRPVNVRGEFLHDKEILIGPRALIENDVVLQRTGSLLSDPKKNQGWLIITPFRLSDSGQVIIINRGWIPTSLRPKEKRQLSMVKGEVELTGVVRLTENRSPFMPKNNPEKNSWMYRDLAQMSAYFDCAPVWLDVKGIPDPPEGWPLPNQTRITMRNEHLSYLVTWYMLSAFTALMWHRYFIRKLPLL